MSLLELHLRVYQVYILVTYYLELLRDHFCNGNTKNIQKRTCCARVESVYCSVRRRRARVNTPPFVVRQGISRVERSLRIRFVIVYRQVYFPAQLVRDFYPQRAPGQAVVTCIALSPLR